jgi:hypothetical protein
MSGCRRRKRGECGRLSPQGFYCLALLIKLGSLGGVALKCPLLEAHAQASHHQQARILKTANPGTIRISEEVNDFDDGSSRIKRLREVSTFEYELR